jgi:hypothetical protein
VGADIVIPEIADYEVRRELSRMGERATLARLDGFRAVARYDSDNATSSGFVGRRP